MGANIYGWVSWWRQGAHRSSTVAYWSSPQALGGTLVGTILGSILFGYLLTQIHLLFPLFFVETAEFPYIDGITTIASFVAMILMAKCRIEAWIYWIVINVISVALYWAKEVYFISILYMIYLILAVLGYRTWKNHLSKNVQASSNA